MSEVYDLKVICFPNGTKEIRIYEKPISSLDEKESERRQAKRERTIKKRLAQTSALAEKVYVPFEDSEIEVVDMDEVEYFEFAEEMRKRKNARDSHRRTLNKIHDLARCENWTMFYTLTFSEDVVDRQDFGACMKKARKWFDNLRQRKANDLKYLLIPELHKDKVSWHIHGLVCNDEGVSYVDSGKKDKDGRTIYNVEKYKFGWSTATKIDDSKRVSSYVLKYITKELCERSLGQRRYFRSNNLQEPTIETYLSSMIFDEGYAREVETCDKILETFGIESEDITRIQSVSSEYCSVTYINSN